MAAPAEAAAPPLAPQPYRVAARREETHDTVTLGLEPVDAPARPAAPGQFHMLWAFGVGEVPISVSGLAADHGVVLHTVRSVGAVTAALAAARPGDVVGLRGPFGVGWGADDAAGLDVVVVAGGIGAAPLRPLVEHVLATRDRFGRVSVVVGARSPRDLLFLDDLDRWRARFDTTVEVTVDHAPATWHGDVGVVTKLLGRLPFDPARTMAFLCGPEIMMRFGARALVDRGVPPSAVRVSMERAMQCAVATCGHCMLGSALLCRDGPVLAFDRAEPRLRVREL